VLTVALTGGIATGKSMVADVFRREGCYLDEADEAAHEIMARGGPVWDKIIAHFGREILNPDRTINRIKLGAIIFSNSGEKIFINNLVHPLVLKKMIETIARLEKEGRRKIFVSNAALILEAGYGPYFDKIVVTWCPEEIQIKRLEERDGIGREEALRKIGSQMSVEEKKKFADYIIDSSGTIDETMARAEAVYRQLLVDYEEKLRRPLS